MMEEYKEYIKNTYLLYEDFLKKLEQETKSEKLDWDTVFDITHMYDTDYFDYILFSNQHHQVNEENSFGVLDPNGISVFLLSEKFIFGKNASSSIEKNLYIVEGLKGKSYQIPLEENKIENLETQIKIYINKKENDFTTIEKNDDLESLIKTYLKK